MFAGVRPDIGQSFSMSSMVRPASAVEIATLINAITAGSGFRLGWHRAESRCKVLVKPMPIEHKSAEHSLKKEHR
jgi:hypothetical protein